MAPRLLTALGAGGGLLILSPRFGDLEAGISEGLEARVQELVLHPWQWGLSLRAPEVRWRPAAPADTVGDTSGRLPAPAHPSSFPWPTCRGSTSSTESSR